MDNAFAQSEPVWRSCKSPDFSFFFDLVKSEWSGEVTRAPLHRLCTLMRKLGAAALVRERLTIEDELLDELQMIRAARKGKSFRAEAVRFTFFREIEGIYDWPSLRQNPQEAQRAVLGYAVVMKIRGAAIGGRDICYILEAVVHEPAKWTTSADGEVCRRVSNYYVHCCRDYRSVVGKSGDSLTLSIRGAFFAQQNGITHVCAHAALRAALHSSPSYDFCGNKLTNKRINEILDIEPGKFEREPLGGLGLPEIRKVVEHVGWRAHFVDFSKSRRADYQSFVYPLVESGFSVILGVDNQEHSHVVTINGHTLNTDRWPLEARRRSIHGEPHISTAEWADHFIAHDDNFGMYITLPTDDISNVVVSTDVELLNLARVPEKTLAQFRDSGAYFPTLKASMALGVVPKDVATNGIIAETLAVACLKTLLGGTKFENAPEAECRWFEILQNAAKPRKSGSQSSLAYRTLWTRRETYINAMRGELEKTRGGERHLLKLSAKLPPTFWVTEFTLPDLYTGNKRKLGDILIKSNATKELYQSLQAVAFAWLPGIAWYGQKAVADCDRSWPISGHVPLLRGMENSSLTQEEW